MRPPTRQDCSCTVVMVGDSKVGKTALASKFRSGKFDSGYTRTGFESMSTSSMVEGNRVNFSILDTSGYQGFIPARELAYREADVFLLCYRISDPSSLFSAINHWVPELRNHAPSTPILLVGCASDQRGDRSVVDSLARHGRSFVSQEQARSFAQQVQAAACLETSARTLSARPVFELAAKIGLEQQRQPDSTNPGQTLQRQPRPGDPLWDQLSSGSSTSSSSSSSFSRSASLSSSLDSTRSSLSLPRITSPLSSRRCSFSRGNKTHSTCPDRMITIRCQRLTIDKIYEEVEIEVPAPIFETLQACNEASGKVEVNKRQSFRTKLKNLFVRD